MNASSNSLLRQYLQKILDWEDSHMNFFAAVRDVPPDMRGKIPDGLPYSVWQLMEHIRLSQKDILNFCTNPDYREQNWPEDFWPKSLEPPNQEAWEESIAGFQRDMEKLKKLAADENLDLSAKIPHGSGQTYLRELLLTADHNAYHIGQIIVLRRLLGIW